MIIDWFYFQVALSPPMLWANYFNDDLYLYAVSTGLNSSILHSKPQACEDTDGWTSVQFMTCWTSSMRKWNREEVTDTSRSATAMLWYRLALRTNGKIQHSLSYVRCMTHTHLKKVKINEKCYEYTIIALTDVPIRHIYLLSELIWSTNTYKGQEESVFAQACG